jgi:hypothetical protein
LPSDKTPDGLPSVENYLITREENNPRAYKDSLLSVVAEIDKNFSSLFDSGKYAIDSIEKGLLSPCSSVEYMGILKSTDCKSNQISFTTVGDQKKPKNALLTLREMSDPEGRNFFPCGNIKNFKEMIIQMGEPLS